MAPGHDLQIQVRLTPRAGVDRVDGVADGVLRCRVTAPPVDGAANAALLRLLARELDIPQSAISLLAGERGRRKRVAIAAAWRSRVEARWPGLAG